MEGDTVQGKNHQGAVTTLVERQTKVVIVIKSHTKSSKDVNHSLETWLAQFPRHLFKSITFDNGKEFAGWRTIANQFDLNIYFAAVGAPNQRDLSENTNGFLRKDGLHHNLIMDQLSDEICSSGCQSTKSYPTKKSGLPDTPGSIHKSNH